MSTLLPNLDDRRWTDLVEEGRALIPVYSPGWTDHNVHDPGITILELLAWLTETDIFRVNRVPDRHRRKLLALVGIRPAHPRAARSVLRLSLAGDESLDLPVGTEFTTRSTPAAAFRTLEALTLAPGGIRAVQSAAAGEFRDLTRAFLAGEPFRPFGTAPEPGAELYLGFLRPLPVGAWTTLHFSAGKGAGREERERIREEARARKNECRPRPENPCLPDQSLDTRTGPDWGETAVRSHHAVRVVWEFRSAAGERWVGLDPTRDEVEDRTRAFTLDGAVRLRLPGPSAPSQLGSIDEPLHWIRARFAAGAYDAAPELLDLSFNGVAVEQAVPASQALAIDPKADLPEIAPKPGERVALRLRLDSRGRIESLRLEESPDDPRFLVLGYQAPSSGADGVLHLEAVWLGAGAGLPGQSFELPFAPAEKRSLRVFGLEEGGVWKEWEARPDLDASGPRSRNLVLDPEASRVAFGDGRRGVAPPVRSLFFATYRVTRAGSGNVGARAIDALAASPRNRVLISDWSGLKEALGSIGNPLAAQGGADAEDVSHATGRAVEMMQTPMRAVTLADYERLARETPGVNLARVTARANLHPTLPCNRAPGVVTLIVLPGLPERRPFPSAGLKRLVKAYLERRRVIGTRLEVIGPSYHPVTIRSRIAPERGVEASALQARIVEALHRFFDPLRGGPQKTGWPFGRDVYRAEVLGVVDAVPGVDHVLSLDLLSEGCEPECGSVCVGATGLVASGDHEIEVISEREAS